MGSSPRVSVVIGVYNCGSLLDETIRSVVGQSLADWELLLVDDGSTDETPAVIERWVQADSRIRGFRQPNSGRPASARNFGIREARAEVITFLDGDDLYHPDKLATVVKLLESLPDVGAVFHEYFYFADGTDPGKGLQYLKHDRYFERAAKVFTLTALDGQPVYLGTNDLVKFMSSESVGVHTSAIAVRRSVLRSIDQPPFNEVLPHGEDIHLWLRIARHTSMAAVATPLSYYRCRSQSWVKVSSRRTLATGAYQVKSDMLRQLEQMLSREEWPQYRDRMARYWNGIAYDCLVAGAVPEARQGFRQGFRIAGSPAVRIRSIKGLMVTALPRFLVRAYWRLRRTGEFEVRAPLVG